MLRWPSVLLVLSLSLPTMADQKTYSPPRPMRESPSVAAPATSALPPEVELNAFNLLVNGSFESNGGVDSNVFAGWTLVDEAGSSGSWYVQTGSTVPNSATLICGDGETVDPPTAGSFAAMTAQDAEGSHILYQDITIPAGANATLSFDVQIRTFAADYSTPDSLSYTTIPNQQFRVDLVDPTAAPDAMGASVLLNAYRTEVGSDLSFGYTTVTVDVSAFAGQTVRLRIAEVDNQQCFIAGVDNVSLAAQIPAAIPAVSPGLLGVMAALLGLAGFWIARR